MKRSLSVILAGAALSALALGPAGAADLPSPAPAPYYGAPPIFTWTGFYVGANAGVGFGQFNQGGSAYFGNAVGGLYGITAGYNYQSGPLVAGVEADLDFGSIYGNATPGTSIWSAGNLTGNGSARVRFGYALGRALLYVTGGYTGAEVTGSLKDVSAVPSVIASQSGFLNGFTVGSGIEFAVTDHISIKGEYMFNDYWASNYFSGTRDNLNAGINLSTFRAGVNYHF